MENKMEKDDDCEYPDTLRNDFMGLWSCPKCKNKTFYLVVERSTDPLINEYRKARGR